MSDLRFALRQFLKNPGFTAVAVVTLALGIGANTAMFSVINAVLLRPLPYPEADQLVTLWERNPERGVEQERVSGPNYLDWRRQNTVFSDMAVSPGWAGAESFNLVLQDGTVKVPGVFASSSWFTTLGVKPLLGRALLPEEDEHEGSRAVVLGHAFWRRQFNSDPKVIGKLLTVDTYGRRDFTIVGVMPADFGLPSKIELWLPLGWMDVSLNDRRSAHWHNVIARLKPGVSLDRARAEMNMIQGRIKQENPGETIGPEVSIVPLLEQAVGAKFRTALFVLWGVVVGVLLIACANVANLMLARAVARRKEMAVRMALGAGRWRVMRQLLAESLLLATGGGLAGVVIGQWGLKFAIAVSPADLPRLAEVSLDRSALLFTFGLAALTSVLFGLMPAWQEASAESNAVLNEAVRGASSGVSARFTRQGLVVAEVATAMVLLAAAGLMLQSFRKLLAADRGYRAEQVLTATLDFSVSGFTTWVRPEATRPQVPLTELLRRVREFPGVESAGAAYRLVRPDNHPPNQSSAIHGRNLNQDERPSVDVNAITPGFLRAFGTPLRQGRDFSEADTLEAQGVVLVNESFVRRFFPNENPLGKFVTHSTAPGPLGSRDAAGVPNWYEIVGVVGDTLSLGLPPQAVPEVYHSYWQYPMQNPAVVVRAAGNASSLWVALQREIKSIMPSLPAAEIRLMTDRVRESVAQPQFQVALLSVFGGLALFLAVFGIYGVVAYSVTQRRREIGVRAALGASPGHLQSLVIGQGMKMTLAGLVLGLILALTVTRVLRSLLYEVRPADPITLIAVSLLLGLAALVACWVPARRAAGINPMEALRYE